MIFEEQQTSSPSRFNPNAPTPGRQRRPFAGANVNPGVGAGLPSGPAALPTLPEPLGKSYSGSSKNPTASPEDDLMAMLRSFFEELNKPFDPNDPEVQIILQNMKANTLQDAGNRGIHGGYSNNLAEQAMARANAGLAMQKKGMAMNALGMYTGATQNQRDFNYGRAKDQYQADMDRWKYDQDQNLDLWKLGGGIVGGLGGGIIGGLAGGPAGAASGAQAGFGIGSNIGGAFGAQGQPPPPRWGGY